MLSPDDVAKTNHAKFVLLIGVVLVIALVVIWVAGCSQRRAGEALQYETVPLTSLDDPQGTVTPVVIHLTPTPYRDDWVVYTNPVFAVSLEHPVNWSVDPDYIYEKLGPLRMSGDNGYVAFSAMNGESLDAVVDMEAHHKILPYGSQPRIENVKLNGQPWQLILPSADQSPEMAYQAAMITPYPEPVTISGASYRFFCIRADYPHIRTLAQTVRFLPVN